MRIGAPTDALGRARAVATASAAMPSPRPTKPIPSPRRGLHVHRARRRARAPRRGASRIASRCGPSFGALAASRVASTLHDAQPALGEQPRRRSRSSSSESASRQRSSVSGKCSPMSPRPAAPSSASITAWVSTSASEWPASPRSRSGSRRRRGQRAPGARGGASRSRCPVRARSSDRLQPPLAAARTRRARSTPSSLEQLDAPRSYRSRAARARGRRCDSATGQPGVEAHLEERRRRVDLADRLAQPGGGHLDRDVRLGDPLHRQLVEAAQVAVGPRPRAAPDLDEVGVGEDVEQAACAPPRRASRSSAPRPSRGRRARRPRRPSRRWSTRLVAEEVDRADHVVPRPRRRAGSRCRSSRPGRKSASIPSRRSVSLAHEVAVGVEVVDAPSAR